MNKTLTIPIAGLMSEKLEDLGGLYITSYLKKMDIRFKFIKKRREYTMV